MPTTRDTPTPAVALQLTESDAARYYNVSKALLRKWRRLGSGPSFFRMGRTIRYQRRDLDAYLEAHRVTTR